MSYPYDKNSQEVLDVHNAESLECQSDKECEAIAAGLNKAFEAGRNRGRQDAAEVISGLQTEAIFDGQIVDAARKLRHEFTQDNLCELYQAVENLKEFQKGSGP